MKHRFLLIFLFFPLLTYSQKAKSILDNAKVYPVRTIQSNDKDFSDLEFLRTLLKDKRIVLLGEQTHGDGATFEAKVRLIKYLHQELGYSMLSFESGFYDNYKAFQQVKLGAPETSALLESIFGIWSDTQEFASLIKYVHEQSNTQAPLLISGFDCQEHTFFQENFLPDLKAAIPLDENDIEILDQVMSAGPEFVASSPEDSTAFYSMSSRVIGSLDRVILTNPSVQNQMLRQTFISWKSMMEWNIDELQEKQVYVQNPRDLQMARNLIFLANLYPERKIIAWGASYHFANQIEQLEFTPVTKKFIHTMDSLARNTEPTDLKEDLKGAVPMGKILKEHFGDALYSVSFSSYEGSYGMVSSHVIPLAPFQPPAGSIEKALVETGIETGFVNYSKESNAAFYSSALANLPVRAPWQNIFDGHFFIKTSYPPSLLPSLEAVATKAQTMPERYAPNPKTKRVVDAKSGEGLAFASIALANSSKGVSSNAQGEFVFNVQSSGKNDQVIISSIGYETRKLTIAELNQQQEIRLVPKAYELDAIEVRAKGLSAKEIIKKAEKAIRANYFQGANSQEVFYRVNEYAKDSLMFSEEAAIMVHDPDGYKTTASASKNLKGQILQLRNTTSNHPHNGIWDGVGNLWLMYSHDVVLGKDNVLHRPIFYSLTHEGINTLDNKRVYEISFDCKRPGAFTTGYGYPAPESAKGKIFIDASTFAVLKFEILIKRKPSSTKKQPYISRSPYGHKLIQTYQEFEGKYFLKYSKQLMYVQYTDTRTNKKSRSISIRELMSAEIETKPINVPSTPVVRIKTVPVAPNSDFWQHHNIIIEDDVDRLYREFGMQEEE